MIGLSGTRKMPRTPGRQPRLTSPKPSMTLQRSIGEAGQLASSLLGAPPTLRLPPAPTLYDPSRPTLSSATMPGLGWSVPTAGLSDNDLYAQARKGALGPTQLSVDLAKTNAAGRGLTAAQDTLREWWDADPEQEGIQLRQPTPYAPPPLPQREFAAYPNRPIPQADRLSLLLAAIGGAIMPEAAGRFASLPLTAASVQSDRAMQDALQRYQADQAINDTRYGDSLMARNDLVSTDLYNRQQESAFDALRRDTGLRLSTLDQNQTENSSLGSGLRPLVAQEQDANLQGVNADIIGQRITRGLNENTLKTNQYLADVQGEVRGYEVQTQDYFRRLQLLAEMGDKQAQRQLDALRIGETGRHNQAMEGIAGYNAVTGRLNADTQRSRLALDQWKQRADPGRNIDVLVEKDMEVTRAYERYWTAKQNYDNMALSTDKQGNPINRTGGDFTRAEQMVRAAEQALQDSKNRAWNRYAPSLGIPLIPAGMLGRMGPSTPASRNIPISTPGAYSLGVGTATPAPRSGGAKGEKGPKGAIR